MIAFADHELAALKDATVVHNHPLAEVDIAEGLTFSRLDFEFAVRHDVAELRVIAGPWRFVLGRPVGGWPADEGVLMGVYNEAEAAARQEFAAEIARGAITPAWGKGLLADATLRRLAAAGWIDYRRERREQRS